MKTIITIIAALMSCAVAAAQQPADTLLSLAKADSVLIIDKKGSVEVRTYLTDTASNTNMLRQTEVRVPVATERVYTVSKTPVRRVAAPAQVDTLVNLETRVEQVRNINSRFDFIIGGLGAGMVSALDAPACLKGGITRSWEIGMLYVLGVRCNLHGRSSSLNLGVGLSGRSIRVGDNVRYVPAGTGAVTAPYPDGAADASAHIYTFSIDVPLLWRQYLPVKPDGRHRMSLLLGGILNFNTYSSVSAHYSLPGDIRVDEKLDASHHRPVTYQLTAGLYFNDWLGAYVKYMPVEPMKLATLSYRPLSVGLQVSF